MEYSYDVIGKIIKEERIKHNYTQKKLGEKIGVVGKQICQYEKGTPPPLSSLLELCKVFNCELGYLIGEKSYQSGTRDLTFISEQTGLSTDAIDSVRKITSSNHSIFRYITNPNLPGQVLNLLLTSPELYDIILTLTQLDELYNKKIQTSIKLQKISDEYGTDKFNEALDILESSYDENDTPDFSEQIINISHQISEILDEGYSNELEYEEKARYHRFVIQEHITRMLNRLYPLHIIENEKE